MKPKPPNSDDQSLERLTRKLERESRAREQAERLLEEKSLELYQTNQKLEAEVQRVRALSQSVDATGDGIALINNKGQFFYINPAYAAMFGYEADALMQLNWMSLYTEAEQERFTHAILPEFQNKGSWQGEAIGQSQFGNQIVQDITLTALPDGGMVFAIRDISERRAREIYARELETRLQKAEREAELFVLGNAVAHDFNNLIAAISSNAMLLKMDLKDDIENYHRANQIEIATQQAAGVIRSLELERSNDTKEITQFDLVELIQTGLQIAHTIRPDHITIETELPETASIYANQVLLTRCLLNIMKNAFAAMPDQGLLHIRLGQDGSGKFTADSHSYILGQPEQMKGYCLEITDSGTGIAPEKLERIFDDFFTSKPKRVGSGLGLYSLKRLTDSAAAGIEVESQEGVGTRFRIRFTVGAPKTTEMLGEEKRPKNKIVSRRKTYPLNIMLVDDNIMVGASLKEQIKRMGHSVAWFQLPAYALSQLEADPEKYDLMITDLSMPEISGDELSKRLKALNPDLSIILYSGQAAYQNDDDIYDAVLQKPITFEGLKQAIDRILS